MANLIRCITEDGEIMAIAIDSTEIVRKAEEIHKTSAVCTAALGRLLTATSMMGNMLKSKNDRINVRIDGKGKAGVLLCIADGDGCVKGSITNPVVEIPLNEKGKLDVKTAVGTDGSITVIKDLGLKEPYTGSTPLVSGEIAEDVTAYYAYSEQIPTVCALGVLVNPDLSVKVAGGYIIQLLPGADEETIEKLEKNISSVRPVTTLLSEGMSIKDIIFDALKGFNVEVIYEADTEYKCNCSREKTFSVLKSMEKESVFEDEDEVEVSCNFCGKHYKFKKSEFQKSKK